MILDIIAAFLIAALAGLGVGSGGLLVVYLVLIKGLEQLPAQGMNLAFFIFAAGAALIIHFKKRKMDFYTLAVMILFGVIGSLIGTKLSGIIDPTILRKIFGGVFTAAGIYTFFSSIGKEKKAVDKN
jgi:uncharacterized membrane protein YfcA